MTQPETRATAAPDTFKPTPSAARAVLKDKGPLTPTKARAADFYAALHRAEPWWPMWLVADLTTVVALLLGTVPLARSTVTLYAAAYSISVMAHAHGGGVDRLLMQTNPDMTAAGKGKVPSPRTIAKAMVAIFMLAAGAVYLLPPVPLRVVGAAFGIVVVVHGWNRVTAHIRSRRVLAKGPDQPWWPAYVADRELRHAAAAVVQHPEG